MATLINFGIKQSDNTYKYYTASINDELDKYGNNVAITEQQTKEQRDAKEKKVYVGNGKVAWTNGKIEVASKKEDTPFYPRSPYGVAKLFGHWIVKNYRESYGMYACSGILFNHESEYRGSEFVTQKIVEKAVAIKKGDNSPLVLGNIDSKRDWGYAKDYVQGMFLMLQQVSADDYVLATNKTTTVRDFVVNVFDKLGIKIVWEGEGIKEKGIDAESGRILVEISKLFYRPAEVDLLIGDYRKAKDKLGWEPSTDLSKLVDIMVSHAQRRI